MWSWLDLERRDVERAAAAMLAVDLAHHRRAHVDDGQIASRSMFALVDLRRASGDAERGRRDEASSTNRPPGTHGVRL